MFEFLLYRAMQPPDGPSHAQVHRMSESAVMPLESRLDRLELACAGLWTLLKNKHGYSDEELIEAIQEADAQDGKVDGRLGRNAKPCPHCKRKLLSRKAPTCPWCGGGVDTEPF